MNTVILMLSLVCAAAAVPLDASNFTNATKYDERIVGGSAARRLQFPYQISYQVYGQHSCGGSILTNEWVLTAGHCVTGSPQNTRVVAGMLHQEENHPDVQICRIQQEIVHPQYQGEASPPPNDIALLRLADRLRFTAAVSPISLPSPNSNHETGMVWLSGWGQLSQDNANTPKTLQYIQMNLITTQQCKDYAPYIHETMMCVLGRNTGACMGDSGGPMMQNGKIVGVASFILPPCGSSLSVYTRVSSFIPWIKQHVPI